jgi:hypothetical protein
VAEGRRAGVLGVLLKRMWALKSPMTMKVRCPGMISRLRSCKKLSYSSIGPSHSAAVRAADALAWCDAVTLHDAVRAAVVVAVAMDVPGDVTLPAGSAHYEQKNIRHPLDSSAHSLP